MEMCSESGYGVIDGVGGRTEYLRDGIRPESESEKVVEKGVSLQEVSPAWKQCQALKKKKKKALLKHMSLYLSSQRTRVKVARAERLWKAPLARLAEVTAES